MNLFRSEEHVKRWPLYYRGVDDYVMPVSDWGTVFSASMFRNRLDADFLARSANYLEDYRQRLQAMGKTLPTPDRTLTTVMFTDIVASTEQAALVGDTDWRSVLERHNEIVRSQLEHFGGNEMKQTGDGFMAAFASPTRAIRGAMAICQAVGEIGIEVRAGVHLGECEILPHDLGGIAVHIAARIAEAAGATQVLVSRTVKDAMTGSGIEFEYQGVYQLKGVPGEWDLHAVVP
jgi:class 3 adenylate cyclase